MKTRQKDKKTRKTIGQRTANNEITNMASSIEDRALSYTQKEISSPLLDQLFPCRALESML